MSAKTYTASAGRFSGSRRVRFEFFHRIAKRVCVAGSFNGWNPSATPLTPAGHGAWLRELWLPPGQYEYLLVVDGKWVFDPNALDYMPNAFGGMNSVVEVHAPVVAHPRRNQSTQVAMRRAQNGKSSAKLTECSV